MLDCEKALKIVKAMAAKKKEYNYGEVETLVPDMKADEVHNTLGELEKMGYLRTRGKDKGKHVHLTGTYEELSEDIEKVCKGR